MLLTTTEVAERFDVNRETVRRWIAEGRLPARQAGIHWLVDEADLVGFVQPKRGNPQWVAQKKD